MSSNEKTNINSQLKPAVLATVASIPKGKVMYYGQIAELVGTTARIAGFVMNGLTEQEMRQVPWHRVVAKDGYISSLKLGEKGYLQKSILEQEGYKIIDDRINMNEHLWLFAGIQRLEDKVEQYSLFIEGAKR
jgi:methylated-DNA-protein-cysteine methyltransferase related protein